MKNAIKSFADLPGPKPGWPLEGGVSTIKLDRLLSFICHYQRTHNGDTPTRAVIAHEMECAEGQVNYLINKLVTLLKVHVISNKPLRIMVLRPGEVRPLQDAREADGWLRERDRDPKREERFQEVEARRQQLARFIGERGHASLRDMMAFMGSDNAGWTQRQAQMLVERGLVESADRGYALTDKGRIAYGMSGPHEKPVKVVEQTVVVVADRPRRRKNMDRVKRMSIHQRAILAGEFLAKYMAEHGVAPEHKEIAVAIGYSVTPGNPGTGAITRVLQHMVECGWITQKPRLHRSVRFTEKGARKFSYANEATTTSAESAPMQNEEYAVRAEDFDPEPKQVTYGLVDYERIGDMVAEAIERRVGKDEPCASPSDYPYPTQTPDHPNRRLLLGHVDTVDLVMELIERGYTVRRS